MSSAMVRVVFSGLFEKGGMDLKTSIQPPYSDHFKEFYCDTAMSGYEPLLRQQTHGFFGTDHVLVRVGHAIRSR